MPRREALINLTPNRYYEIEATLKYKHQTANYTTAIIEQDNTQSKIKIPSSDIEMEEGSSYKFAKCFYSRNGWINVRNPQETIEEVHSNSIVPLSLSTIYTERANLQGKYLTTLLKIISIEPKQTIIKNNKELTLHVLKCFADGMFIDVTVWNREIVTEDLSLRWIVFCGFRMKKLTENHFVFASTVYSRMDLYDVLISEEYDLNKTYNNISMVYQKRSIHQLITNLENKDKQSSILTVKLVEAEAFQYDGCTACHKKLTQNGCPECGVLTIPKKFLVGKVRAEDQFGSILEAFVFDQKIQGMFRFLGKNSIASIKVKSTVKKIEEDVLISHVLTGVESIIF